MLRPLPVKDPDTIRNVFMSTRGGGTYGTPYFVSFAEFTATGLSMLVAATLAAIVPALAALRLDPMVALRDE